MNDFCFAKWTSITNRNMNVIFLERIYINAKRIQLATFFKTNNITENHRIVEHILLTDLFGGMLQVKTDMCWGRACRPQGMLHVLHPTVGRQFSPQPFGGVITMSVVVLFFFWLFHLVLFPLGGRHLSGMLLAPFGPPVLEPHLKHRIKGNR